eukprot:12791473-Alexandrium_andersonii.AAC.1
MSASLVGSEMCIRDRSAPNAAKPPPWSAHGTPPATSTPCKNTHINALPVSYTHLTLPTICSV